MCDRQPKIFFYPLSQFSLETLKKHLLIYLIDIQFFVVSGVNFVDIPSTCNSLRFNLSVIFSAGLLLSNSAKTSFNNYLLISEIVLVLTAKIFNGLCWPKRFLSLLRNSMHFQNADEPERKKIKTFLHKMNATLRC